MRMNIFEDYHVKYFWIFITEKCNLNCDYCFYRNRDSKSLGFSDIKTVLESFPVSDKTEFVISGGEPLIEWGLLKRIINLIKSEFPKNGLLVQTNGILIDKKKIEFFRRMGISLEFGIDGGYKTTSKHRKGTEGFYNTIINNMLKSRMAGIKTTSTLTVHPQEACQVLDNFKEIFRLNIPTEITPAAFEKWQNKNVRDFKHGYLESIQYSVKNRKRSMLKYGYDIPIKSKIIDLIPIADGNVMTNWSFLSLPREKMKEYSIMNISHGILSENHKSMEFLFRIYQKAYKKKNFTYRDYSNVNAKIVSNELGNNMNFQNYLELGRFLKRVNQRFLLNTFNYKP